MSNEFQFRFHSVKIYPAGGPALIITTAWPARGSFGDIFYEGSAFTLLPGKAARAFKYKLQPDLLSMHGIKVDADFILDAGLARAIADLENSLSPTSQACRARKVDQKALYMGRFSGLEYDFAAVERLCDHYVLRDFIRSVLAFPEMKAEVVSA